MTSAYKRVYSFCETPPGVIKEVDCGIGTPNNEYSYFNSQLFTEDCFTVVFNSTAIFEVIEPDFPSAFQLFNLAASSPGSTITSSGANSQFINTVQAGSYRFHVNFTISSVASGVTGRPRITFALGTPAATPYINVNGFLQVSTEFEVFTTNDPNFFGVFECVMHGVVDLPANASTAIMAKPSTLSPDPEYDFGTFNVEVTRIG